MARSVVPISNLAGNRNGSFVNCSVIGADVLGMEWFLNEGDILLIANAGPGATVDVTLKGTADQQGRINDVLVSNMLVGFFIVVGPLKASGWVQASGLMFVDSSASTDHIYTVLRGAH